MRISDWSSDVCSSDLEFNCTRSAGVSGEAELHGVCALWRWPRGPSILTAQAPGRRIACRSVRHPATCDQKSASSNSPASRSRSEEHTSELQSLMRISFAVLCLQKIHYTESNEYNTTS